MTLKLKNSIYLAIVFYEDSLYNDCAQMHDKLSLIAKHIQNNYKNTNFTNFLDTYNISYYKLILDTMISVKTFPLTFSFINKDVRNQAKRKFLRL